MKMSTYDQHQLANILVITNIVTIHYFELDKDFSFAGERHDFWELVYADRGDLLINADGKELVLHTGEIIFHKPNEFHNLRSDGVNAPNAVVATFRTNSEAMKFFEGRCLALPKHLRHLIANIISEAKSAYDLPVFYPFLQNKYVRKGVPIGAEQLLRLYLEQLLILLLREFSETPQTRKFFQSKETFDNHVVTLIIELLNDNLYSKLTISGICRELNYGKTYLCTLFRQVCDYSIMEYYTLLKISEAKRLIREHKYTITQISDMLMWNNPQYFSRQFKAITHQTPREYQNSVKAEPPEQVPRKTKPLNHH